MGEDCEAFVQWCEACPWPEALVKGVVLRLDGGQDLVVEQTAEQGRFVLLQAPVFGPHAAPAEDGSGQLWVADFMLAARRPVKGADAARRWLDETDEPLAADAVPLVFDEEQPDPLARFLLPVLTSLVAGGPRPRRRARTHRGAVTIRVELKGMPEPVWRTLQLGAHDTFEDLHYAIQAAFAWQEMHLHEFRLGKVVLTSPDGESWGQLRESALTLGAYLRAHQRFEYRYDFGDNWVHACTVESMDADRVLQPRLLDGSGDAPAEDSGGPSGYRQHHDAMRRIIRTVESAGGDVRSGDLLSGDDIDEARWWQQWGRPQSFDLEAARAGFPERLDQVLTAMAEPERTETPWPDGDENDTATTGSEVLDRILRRLDIPQVDGIDDLDTLNDDLLPALVEDDSHTPGLFIPERFTQQERWFRTFDGTRADRTNVEVDTGDEDDDAEDEAPPVAGQIVLRIRDTRYRDIDRIAEMTYLDNEGRVTARLTVIDPDDTQGSAIHIYDRRTRPAASTLITTSEANTDLPGLFARHARESVAVVGLTPKGKTANLVLPAGRGHPLVLIETGDENSG